MGLSHLNEKGWARMVDITQKPVTTRMATAIGKIYLKPATLEKVLAGEVVKGNVLSVAQVAGIMAAKRVPELIPLCHPLPISGVEIEFKEDTNTDVNGLCHIAVTATVKTTASTGVEMEALTAVCGAALTIYDMCKSNDRDMSIGEVMLISKSGGESGNYRRKKRRADEAEDSVW